MPLFSIIIPTFNSASTLQAAIESLLCQSFKAYEIWIIDGSSTDNTVEIARKYQLNNPQIHILSEPDKGIYDAMNKGIDRANGEWIYFMGSDDYLINNMVLHELTEKVNLSEYDFVYGNVLSPGYGRIYDGEFDEEKITNQNICHQALFVRKALFERMGKFNTRYFLLADYEFNIRCMFNKKIRKKYVDITIAYYATDGSSISKTDHAFIKDQNFLLLKYGFLSLSWRARARLCKGHFVQFCRYLKFRNAAQ